MSPGSYNEVDLVAVVGVTDGRGDYGGPLENTRSGKGREDWDPWRC